MIKCLYDELVPIDRLIPNPENANEHPSSQIEGLKQIILANGIRQPITVSKLTGYIVRGHARLLALKGLQVKEVPVVYQDYESLDLEYRDLIADNEIARHSHLSEIKMKELNFKVETKATGRQSQSETSEILFDASSDDASSEDKGVAESGILRTCKNCGYQW
jgi:ParB-like chromosome segregation protein Spo0J